MHTLMIIGLIIFAIGLIFVLLDRRWYKRHPGAEEEFARTDNELTSKGR